MSKENVYANIANALSGLQNAGYKPVTEGLGDVLKQYSGGPDAFTGPLTPEEQFSMLSNTMNLHGMDKLRGTDAQAIATLGLMDTIGNQGEDSIDSKSELRRRLRENDAKLGSVGQNAGYIAGNPFGGMADTINDINAGIGSGIDAIAEGTIGNLAGLIGGQQAREGFNNLFSGEDLAIIPDIAEDIALTMIPGVGPAAMVAKNAIQQSDNIYGGLTGTNAVTGEKLTDQQRLGQGAAGALGVGLSMVPGIGKLRNAVDAAADVGKAVSKENAVETADRLAGKARDSLNKEYSDAIKNIDRNQINQQATADAQQQAWDDFANRFNMPLDQSAKERFLANRDVSASANDIADDLYDAAIKEATEGVKTSSPYVKAVQNTADEAARLKGLDVSEFEPDYNAAIKAFLSGGRKDNGIVSRINRATDAAENIQPIKEGGKVTLRDRMKAFSDEMANTPEQTMATQRRLGQSLDDFMKDNDKLVAKDQAAVELSEEATKKAQQEAYNSLSKESKNALDNKTFKAKDGVEADVGAAAEQEYEAALEGTLDEARKAASKEAEKTASKGGKKLDKAKGKLRQSILNPSSMLNTAKQNAIGLPMAYGTMALNYMGNGDYDSLADAATQMNDELLSGNPAALLPLMFPVGMKRMARNIPGPSGRASLNSTQIRNIINNPDIKLPVTRGDLNLPFQTIRAGAAGDWADNAGYMGGYNPEDYQFDNEAAMYQEALRRMENARNY